MLQLSALRPLADRSGPFVTVHADVSRTDESANERLDSVCTTVRHELERHDVPGTVVAEVEERLRAPSEVAGPITRSLFATAEGVAVDEVHRGSSGWGDTVDVGPLPQVAPWVLAADDEFPFALALVDREGADVELYSAYGRLDDAQSLHGETRDISKISPGDWAQKQYQRRAENVWRGNAEMVAEELRSLDRRHHPAFIALAGDARARAEVAGRAADLPIRQVEAGGRGAGASRDGVDEAILRLIGEKAALEEQDLIESLDRGRATGQGIVEGLRETADALVRAEVDTLVLDVRRAHDQVVEPAAHPGLAIPESAARAPSVPADSALVMAAAATGAGLTLMPAALIGDVEAAAVLRWDMGSEP